MLHNKAVAAIASHWPFANGSGRFIDTFGRGVELGKGLRSCTTSDGFVIDVMADDHIGRHILLSGQFDRANVQVLVDFADAGDRIVDVGANIGYVSACLLQNIKGSTILCFEPQPGVVDILRNNLARFGPDRSTIVEAALSDGDGTLVMHIDPVNRGASSIHAVRGSESVSIAAVSADRVLGELDALDLMKIDVEGHEEHVFKSAARQIARLQPKAILFEDATRKAGPEGVIGRILNDSGYNVFGIRKTLVRTTLTPIRATADCDFNDYVAVSRARPAPAAAARRYGLPTAA